MKRWVMLSGVLLAWTAGCGGDDGGGGSGATASTSKCAFSGTVGACDHYVATATCDLTHYFAPVTTGVAKATCTGSGSTFYPP